MSGVELLADRFAGDDGLRDLLDGAEKSDRFRRGVIRVCE